MSIILDASSTLNFLAVGQQNVLIRTAESRALRLAVPETVNGEIPHVAAKPRFSATAAASTWRKLVASGRIEVLSDELLSDELVAAVARVSGIEAEDRVRDRRSLGEIMVIAHGSSLALAGATVFLLIDEGDGRARARAEIAWLEKEKAAGRMYLWSSRLVLQGADPAWFHGGQTWESVYRAMRAYDDALPPS